MYIGNGQFIHAASSRGGVVISSLSETYYSSRFICGRRLG
jgi:cell wall-associated NlpC family hydrolase